MLSILIPCYNYPTFDLVNVLFKQCKKIKIPFEILVSEDGGEEFLEKNKQIDYIENCKYLVNKTNLGRSGNTNRLIKLSKYNLKLILDCDTWPKTSNFISYYLEYSSQFESFVCFGGITYDNNLNKPDNLRYNYGSKREAKLVKQRQKHPVKSLLTSNILLKNCLQLFDERIRTYGYEDLVFAQQIDEKKINILHFNNPVYHTQLESNEDFLLKTQKALQTLISIEKQEIVKTGLTNISSIYHTFSKLYLTGLLNFLYKLLAKICYKHLKSKGKPIWVFDIYKLLFFSKHY